MEKYKILQVDRSSLFSETVLKSFTEEQQAVKCLERLARKKGWKLRKGAMIDRYVDELHTREYYITTKSV